MGQFNIYDKESIAKEKSMNSKQDPSFQEKLPRKKDTFQERIQCERMFPMREDFLTMRKKRRVFVIKRLKLVKQNMVLTKEKAETSKKSWCYKA